jgi:hypothetical protein
MFYIYFFSNFLIIQVIFAERWFQISQFSEYSNFNGQSFQILKIFHFKDNNIRGGNLSNVVLQCLSYTKTPVASL